jgi:hypothetical protein
MSLWTREENALKRKIDVASCNGSGYVQFNETNPQETNMFDYLSETYPAPMSKVVAFALVLLAVTNGYAILAHG